MLPILPVLACGEVIEVHVKDEPCSSGASCHFLCLPHACCDSAFMCSFFLLLLSHLGKLDSGGKAPRALLVPPPPPAPPPHISQRHTHSTSKNIAPSPRVPSAPALPLRQQSSPAQPSQWAAPKEEGRITSAGHAPTLLHLSIYGYFISFFSSLSLSSLSLSHLFSPVLYASHCFSVLLFSLLISSLLLFSSSSFSLHLFFSPLLSSSALILFSSPLLLVCRLFSSSASLISSSLLFPFFLPCFFRGLNSRCFPLVWRQVLLSPVF